MVISWHKRDVLTLGQRRCEARKAWTEGPCLKVLEEVRAFRVLLQIADRLQEGDYLLLRLVSSTKVELGTREFRRLREAPALVRRSGLGQS